MLGLLWGETVLHAGYAYEQDLHSRENQISKVLDAQDKNTSASRRLSVCSVVQKTDCQSKSLAVEQVKLDVLVKDLPSSSLLVKTSFSYAQDKKNFLTPEIYVDRKHRNFQAEIIEIFKQSLVLQDRQDEFPILLECHCDDREPLAYGFILGHRWGKRIKSYLQNLAVHVSHIELMNYGNEYEICDTNWGECQKGSRLQSTFKFLAIRKPNSGCLIRLQLPTQRNQWQEVLEKHSMFLQEIHVAGTSANLRP